MSSLDIRSSNGTPYSVKFINSSSAPWIVYLYQKIPNQPTEIFSLAWQASPIKIAPGAFFSFKWTIDYSYVWGRTGTLTDGVVFEAGQVVDADPSTQNLVTFDAIDNMPAFGPVTGAGKPGVLTIQEGKTFPNNTYTTGIGMSGQASFVQQALTNTTQLYTPTPTYYIAAGVGVQMGQVLAQTASQSAEVKFPVNVYSLNATLDSQQNWSIVPA